MISIRGDHQSPRRDTTDANSDRRTYTRVKMIPHQLPVLKPCGEIPPRETAENASRASALTEATPKGGYGKNTENPLSHQLSMKRGPTTVIVFSCASVHTPNPLISQVLLLPGLISVLLSVLRANLCE